MESATFRKWLAEHGCRFDPHKHHRRGQGAVMITAHRQGRTARVPVGRPGPDHRHPRGPSGVR